MDASQEETSKKHYSSYEEYLNAMYPSASQDRVVENIDPSTFGRAMAQQSLDIVKSLLLIK